MKIMVAICAVAAALFIVKTAWEFHEDHQVQLAAERAYAQRIIAEELGK